ncbi:MAG: hypothetical protein H0U76_19560 [Ktedonobacteraceae bacterium]|nr:hypothetical protein [Ktedonobacteraceae bacterium]
MGSSPNDLGKPSVQISPQFQLQYPARKRTDVEHDQTAYARELVEHHHTARKGHHRAPELHMTANGEDAFLLFL